MTDPRDLLDTLDLAIARADAVLAGPVLQPMALTAQRLRTRSGFLGEVLVVALAGGTGSGKSSILNALIGEQIVETGVVRPTTQHATAVFRTGGAADLQGLFDSVGVERRVAHAAAADLVLIDLPDFDSTAESHRHVVEHVLPRVDAVVWVLDPEKYADPVLHRGFLSGAADHEDLFIFVLNQADRLGSELPIAVASLARLLEEDGFTDPPIVTTVAAPADATDVERLAGLLEDRWDLKTTALRKMALDVKRIARDGWSATRELESPDDTESRDALALARATFVWLGVSAHDVHHRLTT
jgi:GTP-binding protein EngB required for normal cell division